MGSAQWEEHEIEWAWVSRRPDVGIGAQSRDLVRKTSTSMSRSFAMRETWDLLKTLGHHLGECPFGPSPGLEQPVGEVAARSQLRDGQVDRSDPGVEIPGPTAIAAVHPVDRHLAIGRTAAGIGLSGHQRLGEGAHHLFHQIGPIGVEVLRNQSIGSMLCTTSTASSS